MYDKPLVRKYNIPANDFDTVSTTAVNGPAGKKGHVRDVFVDKVTETFVGTTTGAGVLVGLSGTTNAYFASNLTTLQGSAPAVGVPANLADTKTGYNEIPADTAVLITAVAPVGGSISGIADINVYIDWY